MNNFRAYKSWDIANLFEFGKPFKNYVFNQ